MRGRQPCQLQFEIPCIHRERALKNPGRDRRGHRAAVSGGPCTITATTYFG